MSETSEKTVERVREQFPDALLEVQESHDETTLIVSKDVIEDLMRFLRDDAELAYNYLVDVTALDYLHIPANIEQFQARFMVVYHLYSHQNNARVRVKTPLPEGEAVPTICSLWKAANWLEREAYDMFGVEFDGHPDLRRILMPDGYDGHPLRKDYPLRGRGERANFNFDAGQ